MGQRHSLVAFMAVIVAIVGLKWHGEKKTTVLSVWEHGKEAMLQATHDALCEADGVATYNGAAFDLPKLQGEFLLAGMPPAPQVTQIDIYKSARRLGYISNKLDYIAPLLCIGHKVKHEGLELWLKVMDGCPKAQARMAKYCAGDVRLTEAVYDKVRPYIHSHPYMGGDIHPPRLPGLRFNPHTGAGLPAIKGKHSPALSVPGLRHLVPWQSKASLAYDPAVYVAWRGSRARSRSPDGLLPARTACCGGR